MANDVFLLEMGLRIAQRRKELHMTQESLAEAVGLSLQSISCIELGKKGIRPQNLAKLCIALNVTSDFILFGKRTEQQTNDLLSKITTLDDNSYQAIQSLVNLLIKKE